MGTWFDTYSWVGSAPGGGVVVRLEIPKVQGPPSPPPQGTKVPPCSARSPHPHLEVASFFVTGNIQLRSAVGTGTPWASGQQVHEPRRSCELPVRKKRNQICQLLTSGSLPALSMFQSSWGTSAANVCVLWPGDLARMPDAQGWFEIASGWVKKKKCKFGMST